MGLCGFVAVLSGFIENPHPLDEMDICSVVVEGDERDAAA